MCRDKNDEVKNFGCDSSGLKVQQLSKIESLLDEGKSLIAWGMLEQELMPSIWRGHDGQLLIARALSNVGDGRRADYLRVDFYRKNPEHPAALMAMARYMSTAQGAFGGWKWMLEKERIFDYQLNVMMDKGGDYSSVWSDSAKRLRHDWLCHKALLLIEYRDFYSAWQCIDQADEIWNDDPWGVFVRAKVLEKEDRCEEAHLILDKALSNYPLRPFLIHAKSHLLEVMGNVDRACELLAEYAPSFQSGAMWLQLTLLAQQKQNWRQRDAALVECEKCWIRADKRAWGLVAALQIETALDIGEINSAIDCAERVGTPYYAKIASRLRSYSERKSSCFVKDSRKLAVPYVRQNHSTCAPATLAAIFAYWGHEAKHIQIADSICDDGTPNHLQRCWVQSQGWIARDFSVTYEQACELIDRGIPFVLTTVEPTNAHAQAVMGYDRRMEILWLRDSNHTSDKQMDISLLEGRYASGGPRGLVLLPGDKKELLSGLELKDEFVYDKYHELSICLDEHDRDGAEECLNWFFEKCPGHRLALWSKYIVCSYDGNTQRMFESLSDLVTRYPDDEGLLIRYLALASDQVSHCEREKKLEAICLNSDCDSVFLEMLSDALASDSSSRKRGIRLIRSVIKKSMPSANALNVYAGYLWRDARTRSSAIDAYWFAAMLEPRSLSHMQQWIRVEGFEGSSCISRPFEMVLRKRFQDSCEKNANASIALVQYLLLSGRYDEALGVLDIALGKLPCNSDLSLYAVYFYMQSGDLSRASEVLEDSKVFAKKVDWNRMAAEFNQYRGHLARALELWRDVVKIQPLAIDAHESIAYLLSQTESSTSAGDYLESVSKKNPYCMGLQRIYCAWIDSSLKGGRRKFLLALDSVLEVDPKAVWALRAKANYYLDEYSVCKLNISKVESNDYLNKISEICDRVVEVNSDEVSTYLLQARLHAECDSEKDSDLAREFALRAVLSSPADEAAVLLFYEYWSIEKQLRQQALAEHFQALLEKPFASSGLKLYRNTAVISLKDEEVLLKLKEYARKNPLRIHGFLVLADHLLQMDRADEARSIMAQAGDQFQLEPDWWNLLSRIERADLNFDKSYEAIRRAIDLSPFNVELRICCADICRSMLKADKAIRVLEDGLRIQPNAIQLTAALSEYHVINDDPKEAFELLLSALMKEPRHRREWDYCIRLANMCSCLDEIEFCLKNISDQRPGSAELAVLQAIVCMHRSDWEQSLGYLNTAIQLDPFLIEAYDWRVHNLTMLHRFDEAQTACDVPHMDSGQSVQLQGRYAWVLAECGKVSQAIGQMKKVLKRYPTYEWGWRQLFQWAELENKMQIAMDAAENLVRLSPHDPKSLLWRAICFMRMANEKSIPEKKQILLKAIADLKHAFKLNPSDEEVSSRLFDLLIDMNRHEEASEVFDVAKLYLVANGRVESMGLRLGLCVNSEKQITECIELIRKADSLDPEVVYPSLFDLRSKISRRKWHKFIKSVLKDLRSGCVSNGLLYALVPLFDDDCLTQAIRCVARIKTDQGRMVWCAAACELLKRFGERSCGGAFGLCGLTFFFLKNKKKILGYPSQDSHDVVGRSCWALLQHGHDRMCLHLFSDWQDVESAGGWFYLNLAQAAYGLNRNYVAGPILEYMLTQIAPDHTYERSRVLAALICLHENEVSRAKVLLDGVEVAALDEVGKNYYRWSLAAFNAMDGDMDKAREIFRVGINGQSRVSYGKNLSGKAERRAFRFAKKLTKKRFGFLS